MTVLLDMQDLIYKATKDPDCRKDTLARLALAWERLEERRRIMKGKPLPGNLRPAEPKRRGKKTGITLGHVLELPEKQVEPPAEPPASAAVG